MYANMKKWPLEQVIIDLTHDKVTVESEEPNAQARKVDKYVRHIQFKGPLSSEQRTRLLEIANKCPVHKSLDQGTNIVETYLVQ
jgi:uncharacterized OsmC-like protein